MAGSSTNTYSDVASPDSWVCHVGLARPVFGVNNIFDKFVSLYICVRIKVIFKMYKRSRRTKILIIKSKIKEFLLPSLWLGWWSKPNFKERRVMFKMYKRSRRVVSSLSLVLDCNYSCELHVFI